MWLENTSYYNDKNLPKISKKNDLNMVIKYAYKKKQEWWASHLDFIILFSRFLQYCDFNNREDFFKQWEHYLNIKAYNYNQDYEKYVIYTTAVSHIYYLMSNLEKINDEYSHLCVTTIFEFYNKPHKDINVIVYYEYLELFANMLSSYKVSYLSELYYHKCENILTTIIHNNKADNRSCEFSDIGLYYVFFARIKHIHQLYKQSSLAFYLDFWDIETLLTERNNFYKDISRKNMKSTDSDTVISLHKDYFQFYYNEFIKIKEEKIKEWQTHTLNGLGFWLIDVTPKRVIEKLIKSFYDKFFIPQWDNKSLKIKQQQKILIFIEELIEYFVWLQKDFEAITNTSLSILEKWFFIKRWFTTCIDALNKVIVMFHIIKTQKIDHDRYPSYSKRWEIKEFLENLIYKRESQFLIWLHNCFFWNKLREDIIKNKRNRGVHSFFWKIKKTDHLSLLNCYKFTLAIYQNTILYFLEESN